PKACIATYYRQAAAAGAGSAVLQLPKVHDEIDVEQMTYLAVSEPLAHLPWAVKGNMDEKTVARIRRAGERLGTHPEGRKVLAAARLTALVAATDAEYDPHRHIVRVVLGEDY
ncbi:MAG: PhnD/SsuA/transferrin family substrate-binding protein, partial [Pseudomonadota bacterium]